MKNAAKLQRSLYYSNLQQSPIRMSHKKTAIQRQIDATDKQIDGLLYKLYGMTHEEIRIVEEATK